MENGEIELIKELTIRELQVYTTEQILRLVPSVVNRLIKTRQRELQDYIIQQIEDIAAPIVAQLYLGDKEDN